jgi:hypothetical protein
MHDSRRPSGSSDVGVSQRRFAPQQLRHVLGVLLMSLSLLSAVPASASAQLPPQGAYDACYPGDLPAQCAARVQQMAAAGFRLVLNYWMLSSSTSHQVVDYVTTAQASGVQTIWPMNDFWQSDPNGSDLVTSYPLLALGCKCNTNAGLVAYVVTLAKSQPGTWGYYVADEPPLANASQLASFVARIKAIDPVHPVLIVAGPNSSTPGYLPTYAKTTDVLAQDSYPVTSEPVNDPSAATAVAAATQQVQQASNSAGIKSAMVLQAWNWNDSLADQPYGSVVTHFPTATEMTMMRNAALQNGHPSIILWWGLFDVWGYLPVEQPSYFLVPPDPAVRWSSLTQAAFAPEPVGRPVTTTSPPTSSHPCNALALGKSKVTRKRQIKLAVAVCAKGKVMLTGTFGKKKNYGKALLTANRGGELTLTIRPSAAARWALTHKKKLKVKLTVTYEPTVGTPTVATSAQSVT